jgi:hypothetical protein
MGAPVTLHLYDLTKGMAAALSPMLLGRRIEGIWHSGAPAGKDSAHCRGSPAAAAAAVAAVAATAVATCAWNRRPGLLLLPSQERMRAGTCEPGRRMCAARAPDLPMRPARALPRASCTCAASGARRGL